MTIGTGSVVTIEYTLTDDTGNIVDTSKGDEPLAYLHGTNSLVPGLERELEGRKAGDEFSVTVAPAAGYGERRDDLVTEVNKADLSSIPGLEVGMQLQSRSQSGIQIHTVVAIQDETVVLDANHPLAGQTLNFAIKVMDVRTATDEEMAHGHIHGPGGHHHHH